MRPFALFLAASLLPAAEVPAACPSGAWAPAPPLAEARADAAAVVLGDGRILVASGYGAGGASLGSVEAYDPASRTWQALASLSLPRKYATATLLSDGSVLVAGGRDGAGSPVTAAEMYSPATDSWLVVGSLQEGRIFHQATLLPGGDVLLTGGTSADSGVTRSSCELFRPATLDFVPVAPMPFSAGEHEALLLPDGKVLVTGGRGDDGSGNRQLRAAALYDPGTAAWTRLPDMGTERESHSMLLLPSGNVLVAGGATLGEWPLASAEIFDPTSLSFAPTGSMAVERAHAAVLDLACGRALIIGGTLSSHFADESLSACESYDEAAGTWSPGPALVTPRHVARAYAVGRGAIVIGGDSRPGPTAVASVEILESGELPVRIDVKPGNPRGTLNAGASGVLRVVVFGSAELDVTDIDQSSIRLAGAPVRTLGSGRFDCRTDDRDGDGIDDLDCRVDVQDMSVPEDAESLELTASLDDGTLVTGSDDISLVPRPRRTR